MELVARFPDDSEQPRIQQGVPAVLKSQYISLLKQIAKSASNVDIHIQVRDGSVDRISHVVVDFSL